MALRSAVTAVVVALLLGGCSAPVVALPEGISVSVRQTRFDGPLRQVQLVVANASGQPFEVVSAELRSTRFETAVRFDRPQTVPDGSFRDLPVRLPGATCADGLPTDEIALEFANIGLNFLDISDKHSQGFVWRQRDERVDPVAVTKGGFDMPDLFIQFADLLLENLVVVFQPIFTEVADRVLVNVFQLQLELQQLQQVVLVVGLIDALHQFGLPFALLRIVFAIRVQGARQLPIDFANAERDLSLVFLGERLCRKLSG